MSALPLRDEIKFQHRVLIGGSRSSDEPDTSILNIEDPFKIHSSFKQLNDSLRDISEWQIIDSLTAFRELRSLGFSLDGSPNSMIAVRGVGKTGAEAYIIGNLKKDANDIVHLELASTSTFIRDPSRFDLVTGNVAWNLYYSPPFVEFRNFGNLDSEFICPASVVLHSVLAESSNHTYLNLLNDFIHLQTASEIEDIACVQSIRNVQWRGCMHYLRIPTDTKRLGAIFEKEAIREEYMQVKDLVPYHNPAGFLFELLMLSRLEKPREDENSLQPEKDVPENDLCSMDSLRDLIRTFKQRPEHKYIAHTIRIYGDIEYGDQKLILRIQYPVHPSNRSEIEIRFSVPGSEFPMLRLKDKEAEQVISQFGILEALQVDKLLPRAPQA